MPSGMIASPNYLKGTYKNNSECEWEIVVDEGYHIGLRFLNRFFIESSPNCTRDFLEVLNLVSAATLCILKYILSRFSTLRMVIGNHSDELVAEKFQNRLILQRIG